MKNDMILSILVCDDDKYFFEILRDYLCKNMYFNKSDFLYSGNKEDMLKIDDTPDGAEYFKYQRQVNSSVNSVATHNVIEKYIKKNGEDYRFEVSPSVEKTLRDRKSDNTELARKKGY